MSIIGDNIRALRARESLTQQELADMIHVTRETVNKWESGAIEALREHNVVLLCRLFDLQPDDLKSEARGLSAKSKTYMGNSDGGPWTNHLGVAELAWRLHPHAFAIEMDSSMTRVLPCGSLAIADPDTPAASGSLVVIEAPDDRGGKLLVRRLQRGATKSLLCAESYEEQIDDLVVDNDKLHLLGTIIWYQPPRKLS